MAKEKRTVTELKPLPKTVEIPLSLLKHLVRQTNNRQARSFLRKATGQTFSTNAPGANIIEPVKVKAKEATTKPTPEPKIKKRAEVAREKAVGKRPIDKVFKK